MSKHVMSMTCPAKLEAVFSGECTQTIRLGGKYSVGDEILIHDWEGRPYRSKWGRRLRVVVVLVQDMILYEKRFDLCFHGLTDSIPKKWGGVMSDAIAIGDGLKNGLTLKAELKHLNGIREFSGEIAQIIVWEVSC